MNASATSLVLLVEDNPDDADLTVQAFRLNRIEAQLVVAKNGIEALDLLFSTGSRSGLDPLRPAVILLDLKLPGMNGPEVLRRVRADHRTREIPVVVLTSSGEEKDRREAAQVGANDYLRKPVDFLEFRKMTRTLARTWLGHDPGSKDAS